MPVRKWYFCVNELGYRRTRSLIKVAVSSALANTDLQPICIYNGTRAAQVADLERMGARVVRRRSSFEEDLRAGYGKDFDIYSGHWLRVDLPLIEQEDEVVLYTDIDVMFVRPPVFGRPPRYIAAAPEIHRWRYTHFNSGVMVMNLEGLRRVQDAFLDSIRHRLRHGFRYPGHDQVSYNRFFWWRYTPMRSRMNWKPYWGIDEEARIVHFHGPKPSNIRDLKAGKGDRMMGIYGDLWRRNPEAYAHYGAEFDRYLARE